MAVVQRGHRAMVPPFGAFTSQVRWIGAINFGFAIAGFLINAAIALTNWRGAFFLLTILAVVLSIPAALFFLKDDPATVSQVTPEELEHITSDTVTQQLPGPEKRALMLTWPYMVVVVGWIANNIGVWGLASWFPSYLKTEHVSKGTASTYILLAFVLCIAVSPIIAIGMDRLGRKAVFSVGGFVIAAICLLLTQSTQSTRLQLVLVVVAIVGIEGVTTLAGQGVLHSMAPERRMGRAAGVMSGVGNFIGAFGATVMGVFISAGGYSAAFSFLIGVFVIGAACSLALHRIRY